MDSSRDTPDASLASLVHDVTLASERLRARWRNQLGVSAYEMLAMSHLAHEGRMTIGELGTRLALTSGAMTGLIDRLERTGRVQRVRDDLDRRRVQLQVTEAAEHELAELARSLTERIDRLTPGDGGGSTELMARVLGCYVQELEETP